MTGAAFGPATEIDDIDRIRTVCTSFIRSVLTEADADGVVVGLDGELESTTAATLAVEALGPERVYGLVLPSSKLGSKGAREAEAIAEALGIESETVHLQPLLMCFGDMAPAHTDLHGDPIARENLVARLRMTMWYLAANAMERLVVGSTTRTGLLLGTFSKHGDGAADLLPLGGLYRTEVEALAEAFDVPSFAIEPSDIESCYPDHIGVDRTGLDVAPATIDAVLRRLVEGERDPEKLQAALEIDVDREAVERIVRHHRLTEHKRRRPPVGPTIE